jgi:hypothetical protein
MSKFVLFSFIYLSSIQFVFGQIPERYLTDSYEPESFEVRKSKVYIDGQYIPKDLKDAMNELDKRMEDDAKQAFMSLTEEEAGKKAFFSFGRWMMLKWGMEDGSRYTAFFQSNEIGVVEDMVRITMLCYHRHLHSKPLEEQVFMQRFKEVRKKEFEEKQKKLLKYSRKLEPEKEGGQQ